MTRTIRIALVGLGNVGRSFLDLMVSKAPVLADRYGLELVLTGRPIRPRAVMVAGGIDPAALSAHKARGGNAANFVQGVPGMRARRSWPRKWRPICCWKRRSSTCKRGSRASIAPERPSGAG